MAFAKARTALAQLEEKLRRQLGLAGEIRAEFQPVLTPVIIAGDLRDAGNASNHGRAFSWSFLAATGANTFLSLRFEQDCFVDRLVMSNTVAAALQCWLTVPGQAPAVAVTTLAGTWTDRKLIAGDQAPLTESAAFGALTGTAVSDQNRIAGVSIGAGSIVYGWELNLMVPAQSHLNFNVGAVGTGGISIRGRIWP